jgi:hypothetical protein
MHSGHRPCLKTCGIPPEIDHRKLEKGLLSADRARAPEPPKRGGSLPARWLDNMTALNGWPAVNDVFCGFFEAGKDQPFERV